jgi:hypothetical protein
VPANQFYFLSPEISYDPEFEENQKSLDPLPKMGLTEYKKNRLLRQPVFCNSLNRKEISF